VWEKFVRKVNLESVYSLSDSDTSRHRIRGFDICRKQIFINVYSLFNHMKLLNHLFSSTEYVTREIEADEESILKHWKHYIGTISKKKEIIEKLRLDNNFKTNLQELKKLLELGLVDISREERDESEIISDLEAIEHSQKVKRVHKLEQCLGYAETKYEYVHRLLHQLYAILKIQIHIVLKLQIGSRDTEKLISHLKLQLELEIELLNKIEKIETFHNLFLALIKGEHIIKTMDEREKRLLKKMQKGISKIFFNEINEGITYEWAMTIFNAIEDKVHEGVANGMFPRYHPDIDFEFANRPEFVDFVREGIQSLRKRKVSEQMINVFVHLFREWYNHERD
jgi:hypothetical protein